MNQIIKDYADKYNITIIKSKQTNGNIAFCNNGTAKERRENFYSFWNAINHYAEPRCGLYTYTDEIGRECEKIALFF